MVPNPAKKPAYRDVEKARRALHLAEPASDAALLAAQCPQPGTSVVLTNAMINTINAEVHTAETAFNTAQSLARAIVTATGYTRADDEALTLIRTALAGSNDITRDHDTLHIRLDPLSAPRPPPSTNSAKPPTTPTPSTPAPA